MKTTFLVARIAPAIVGALLVGCATSQPEIARHAFSFVHQGETYDILSTDARLGEAGNLLVLRKEGRFMIRAVDYDQDGTLDTLLFGDLTLEAANEIYLAGIDTARRQGKFGVRPPLRVYDSIRPEGTYTIQSNVSGPSSWCNKFTRKTTLLQNAFTALDVNGDGILDRVQEGRIALEAAQSLYESIVEEGVGDGRIERMNGGLIVRPAATVASKGL